MSNRNASKITKKVKEILGLNTGPTEAWFYGQAKDLKFQSHIRPEIETYYDVYLELSKGKEITDDLFKDILLIGLNLKDSEQNYVFDVPISSSAIIKAVPTKENYSIITYTKDSLKNYSEEKNIKISEPPNEESDFKNYMEVLCSVLMHMMYFTSKRIDNKINRIKKGLDILSLPYTGKENYITFNAKFCKNIHKVAQNTLWKPIISVIIIKSFAKYTAENNKKLKTFIEWQIMEDTFLYNYGIVRLMTKFIELTQFDIDQFLNFCFCNSIKREFEKTIKPLQKIITPSNSNLEEWFFYKWGGLIDENYTKGFDLKLYPGLSSMMIGFLNSLLDLDDLPIVFKAFPTSSYKVKYYDWGLRLSKYFRNIPVSYMIKEAYRVWKDLDNETSNDQTNAYTMCILKTHKKIVKKKEEKSCGICLDEITKMNNKKFGLIKNCKHIFCYDCIDMWVNRSFNRTCPECRTTIGSIKQSDKYIEDNTEKLRFFDIPSRPMLMPNSIVF